MIGKHTNFVQFCNLWTEFSPATEIDGTPYIVVPKVGVDAVKKSFADAGINVVVHRFPNPQDPTCVIFPK